MENLIELLKKIITNVLTALYQPFWFAVILTVFLLFFYLYTYKPIDTGKGIRAAFRAWWQEFRTSLFFRKLFLLTLFTVMILFQTLINRNMWINPLSDIMGGWWIWHTAADGTVTLTTECFENIALMLPFTALLLWTVAEKIFCGRKITFFQVLNNAINTKQYRFDKEKRVQMRRSLGVSDDEFVIGHVGRFSPVKNHLFLLKVYKEILKEKKSKLLMVGDGQLRKEIEQEIERLGIASNVILTGVRQDVCDLMQAMDVFVLPSLYEGLGIVGVEAQAAGLPCVFSENIPQEVILTNDAKRIALTTSMDEWAKQILEMRNKERTDTYDVICRAGYDINNNVKKLEEYYLNLLK